MLYFLLDTSLRFFRARRIFSERSGGSRIPRRRNRRPAREPGFGSRESPAPCSRMPQRRPAPGPRIPKKPAAAFAPPPCAGAGVRDSGRVSDSPEFAGSRSAARRRGGWRGPDSFLVLPRGAMLVKTFCGLKKSYDNYSRYRLFGQEREPLSSCRDGRRFPHTSSARTHVPPWKTRTRRWRATAP